MGFLLFPYVKVRANEFVKLVGAIIYLMKEKVFLVLNDVLHFIDEELV